jgi:hypothetical protein
MTTIAAPDALDARWRRMVEPATTLGGLALATVALHVRDPHVHGSWGVCPLAAIGIYCPGCGGLRAVNDLTRGDVGAAASSNLAFVVLLPFIVLGLGLWVRSRWRGVPLRVNPRVAARVTWAGFAVLMVFTVLRNLPGSWLAP